MKDKLEHNFKANTRNTNMGCNATSGNNIDNSSINNNSGINNNRRVNIIRNISSSNRINIKKVSVTRVLLEKKKKIKHQRL